jgi:lysophospholipase L1-like esterase
MTTHSAKRILVFGDSNTWGWTPRNDQQPTTRLAENLRWPGVMAEKIGPGYQIIEEALSARTTNLDDPGEDLPSEYLRGATLNGAKVLPALLASHLPLDLVVIMLGVNDLKARFRRTATEIAEAAISLVQIIRECEGGVFTVYPSPKVLLLVPPPMGTTFHNPEMWVGAPEKSLMLGSEFKSAAISANIPVFDTSEVITTDGVDGVHLTAEAHRRLGLTVAQKVQELI